MIEVKGLCKEFNDLITHSTYTNQEQKKLLLNYRKKRNLLSSKDELFLINCLEERKEILFIIELLSILETLPDALLTPLIDFSLFLGDSDRDREIMETCMRVFGFYKVDEVLFIAFQKGDDIQKNKVISLLYYAIDQPYTWDEHLGYYDLDFDSIEKYYENNKNHRSKYFLKSILEVFFTTKNHDLKYNICLMFRESDLSDSFPTELQELAKKVITSCQGIKLK